MIYRVLTIPGGCLGFLPSTVSIGRQLHHQKTGRGNHASIFLKKKRWNLLSYDMLSVGFWYLQTRNGWRVVITMYHGSFLPTCRWNMATWTPGYVGKYSPHGAFGVCNKNYLRGDDGDVFSPKILSHYLWIVSRMSVFVEWIVVIVESWRNTPCFIISPPNSGAVLFI